MKKSLVVLIALVAAVLLVSAPVRAEEPKFFATQAACESALVSGGFVPYEPKFFGLNKKNPTNGTTKVVAKLEADACLHMLTTVKTNGSNMQWVVQLTGTSLRWDDVNTDGNLEQPYARDDCGNPIDGISYGPPPVIPTKPVAPTAATTTAPAAGPVSQVATQTVSQPAPQIIYLQQAPAPAVAPAPSQAVGFWGGFTGGFTGALAGSVLGDLLLSPVPVVATSSNYYSDYYSGYGDTPRRGRDWGRDHGGSNYYPSPPPPPRQGRGPGQGRIGGYN